MANISPEARLWRARQDSASAKSDCRNCRTLYHKPSNKAYICPLCGFDNLSGPDVSPAAIMARLSQIEEKLDEIQTSLDLMYGDAERERFEQDIRSIQASIRSV